MQQTPLFKNHYFHQLPEFYTALQPKPLHGARLLYHSEGWPPNSVCLLTGLRQNRMLFERRAFVAGMESRWRRCIAAISLACGPANWVTGAASCWENNSWQMVAAWTGT